MRARLGLLMAQQQVMLRAIVMKNKPADMLALSPKGTVPVLVFPDAQARLSSDSHIIDESLDIMIWALQKNDPEDLLQKEFPDHLSAMIDLIHDNDHIFKPQLEIYKKAKRFHLDTELLERQKCEAFIAKLERRLAQPVSSEDTHGYFIGNKPSLLDYALLPFVRQFSRVNRAWFVQAPYPHLRAWLNSHLQSRVYSKAMAKYPLWLDEQANCLLGERA